MLHYSDCLKNMSILLAFCSRSVEKRVIKWIVSAKLNVIWPRQQASIPAYSRQAGRSRCAHLHPKAALLATSSCVPHWHVLNRYSLEMLKDSQLELKSFGSSDMSPCVYHIIVPSTQEQGSNFSDAKSAGYYNKSRILFEFFFEANVHLLHQRLRRYQMKLVLGSVSGSFPNGSVISLYLIFMWILSAWHVS